MCYHLRGATLKFHIKLNYNHSSNYKREREMDKKKILAVAWKRTRFNRMSIQSVQLYLILCNLNTKSDAWYTLQCEMEVKSILTMSMIWVQRYLSQFNNGKYSRHFVTCLFFLEKTFSYSAKTEKLYIFSKDFLVMPAMIT